MGTKNTGTGSADDDTMRSLTLKDFRSASATKPSEAGQLDDATGVLPNERPVENADDLVRSGTLADWRGVESSSATNDTADTTSTRGGSAKPEREVTKGQPEDTMRGGPSQDRR